MTSVRPIRVPPLVGGYVGELITLALPAVVALGLWVNKNRKKQKAKARRVTYPDGTMVEEIEIEVSESASDTEVAKALANGLKLPGVSTNN
jgi:hypothetical protein